ncbi:hypothetical protein MOE86_20015 [Bacillus atrophaeus]|uniref:hypothetical protein n=1 Tax=Bacillus atrophaeus TaxID=1452 RepID=UPI0022809A35|nr:hypothetical protein [Bacillus atrophaeus]MCY9198917.1 hypothetical protein [Bacillus atrophaeus]
MEYKTITVTKPRFGVGRVVSLLIGLLLILVAFVLSLTIIGIVAGAVLVVFSLPFFAIAKGGAKYTCPNCGYKHNGVGTGSVNATCRRCKQNIAVDWVDPPSKKKSENVS